MSSLSCGMGLHFLIAGISFLPAATLYCHFPMVTAGMCPSKVSENSACRRHVFRLHFWETTSWYLVRYISIYTGIWHSETGTAVLSISDLGVATECECYWYLCLYYGYLILPWGIMKNQTYLVTVTFSYPEERKRVLSEKVHSGQLIHWVLYIHGICICVLL